MRYVTVTGEQLAQLRSVLSLLDQVDGLDDRFSLFLYGVTASEEALSKIKERLRDDLDMDDGDADEGLVPEIREAALAIPVSSSALYYLTGSGLKLSDEEAAYRTADEGVRAIYLSGSGGGWPAKVAVADFSAMAIAADTAWLDDFLEQYGRAPGPEAPVARDSRAASANPIDRFLSR